MSGETVEMSQTEGIPGPGGEEGVLGSLGQVTVLTLGDIPADLLVPALPPVGVRGENTEN